MKTQTKAMRLFCPHCDQPLAGIFHVDFPISEEVFGLQQSIVPPPPAVPLAGIHRNGQEAPAKDITEVEVGRWPLKFET